MGKNQTGGISPQGGLTGTRGCGEETDMITLQCGQVS